MYTYGQKGFPMGRRNPLWAEGIPYGQKRFPMAEGIPYGQKAFPTGRRHSQHSAIEIGRAHV